MLCSTIMFFAIVSKIFWQMDYTRINSQWCHGWKKVGRAGSCNKLLDRHSRFLTEFWPTAAISTEEIICSQDLNFASIFFLNVGYQSQILYFWMEIFQEFSNTQNLWWGLPSHDTTVNSHVCCVVCVFQSGVLYISSSIARLWLCHWSGGSERFLVDDWCTSYTRLSWRYGIYIPDTIHSNGKRLLTVFAYRVIVVCNARIFVHQIFSFICFFS